MAPNSQTPGHHDNPSADQIPLQDLSRFEGPADERGRGRANSARSGLFSRRSLIRGGSRRHYQSVAEDSPVELVGAIRNPFRPARYGGRESDEIPPEALAQAMSFGATFDNSHQTTATAGPSSIHDFDDAASDLDNVPLDAYATHDHGGYLAPRVEDEDDTARLTDPRYLQPISGAPGEEGRQSSDTGVHTVHFGQGARLGDDLPHLEEGLSRSRGSSARSRSLSPSASGGALQRASSMVKSMSQRVVNLSNEPEVIEQSIEREESHKNSRLEGPPLLPQCWTMRMILHPMQLDERSGHQGGCGDTKITHSEAGHSVYWVRITPFDYGCVMFSSIQSWNHLSWALLSSRLFYSLWNPQNPFSITPWLCDGQQPARLHFLRHFRHLYTRNNCQNPGVRLYVQPSRVQYSQSIFGHSQSDCGEGQEPDHASSTSDNEKSLVSSTRTARIYSSDVNWNESVRP